MKKNIVVSWGVGFFCMKENKLVTHNVTSIYIDKTSTVNVCVHKGRDVEVIKLSMDEAQEIGFINIKALTKYCK
jgi:hypothetical protein